MKLLVMERHLGEGMFPLFAKGTAVTDVADCEGTPHWRSCVIEGYETYIPETYIVDGVLNRDYDPTELVVEKDQIVALVEVAFQWLYVADENGKRGWLPASKVITA